MVGVSRSDAAATNVPIAIVCIEPCAHILETLSQPSAIVCRPRAASDIAANLGSEYAQECGDSHPKTQQGNPTKSELNQRSTGVDRPQRPTPLGSIDQVVLQSYTNSADTLVARKLLGCPRVTALSGHGTILQRTR